MIGITVLEALVVVVVIVEVVGGGGEGGTFFILTVTQHRSDVETNSLYTEKIRIFNQSGQCDA
jgi:hypothetical protein